MSIERKTSAILEFQLGSTGRNYRTRLCKVCLSGCTTIHSYIHNYNQLSRKKRDDDKDDGGDDYFTTEILKESSVSTNI